MSMRRMRIGAAALMLAGAVQAQDPPASGALTNAQAQARQFGIFFGGTASQYDLCVKKGFLAKGDQTAEQIAQSILEKMRATSLGPDQSAYVQEGWDMMKKEISEHESFYTQEKCTWVGKEWVKMMATMRKK
jgi:hypothetical protein